MNASIDADLFWLVLSIVLTVLLPIPYLVNRIIEQGFKKNILGSIPVFETDCGWAQRAMRAHANAIENLVVFAPLVIIIHMLELQNENTILATQVFFYGRLGHAITYWLGITPLRMLSFAAGLFATLYLAFELVS